MEQQQYLSILLSEWKKRQIPEPEFSRVKWLQEWM
jgi:hypothetical protein